MLRIQWICVLVVAAFLAPAPAMADEFSSRGGPSIGFGIGAARSSCAQGDCSSAGTGAFDLHVGTMFSPRLGVTLDVWGMADDGAEAEMNHGIATVGPRLWVMPWLWLYGGLGLARAHIEPVDIAIESRTAYDPAWVLAAGWELLEIDDFAFDLQLRASENTFASEPDRVRVLGLALGANWY